LVSRLASSNGLSGRNRRSRLSFAALLAACTAASAQPPEATSTNPSEGSNRPASDVRAQTRIVQRGSTAVTEAQASELTLTLTEVATRPIQTWVRTAGSVDASGKIVTTTLRSPEADKVEVGQRVRAYTVAQRSQMYQAKISGVSPVSGGARVEATLASQARDRNVRYLLEIVVEQGPFLSVPNASIIEEGSGKVVYVQEAPGVYAPRTIHTGIEGELYTQIVDGLAEGDQIVSIGSFFVDADNKLKGSAE
jgi:hypothetical protein